MASSLEKGELSKITTAYTKELEALQKGNTRGTAVRKDNTVRKRAKAADLACRKAKMGGGRPRRRHKHTLKRTR